jgi:hypothetical protein
VLLHRAVAWISTVGVAIIVALAVPVSQLRTIEVIKTCCCPDPANCHCPDHKPDSSSQPMMRACHNTEREIIAPQLPAFDPPRVAILAVPAVVAVVTAPALPVPHPAPPPIRPAAPS